jgi:DNA topoisomerase IB
MELIKHPEFGETAKKLAKRIHNAMSVFSIGHYIDRRIDSRLADIRREEDKKGAQILAERIFRCLEQGFKTIKNN